MVDLKAVIQFAIRIHEGQFRKYTNTPYALHLARVAGLVSYYTNGNLEAMAGAYLHDSVEDQPDRCSLELIEQMFGGEVAAIVCGMTNRSKLPEYKDLTRVERKQIDRVHLSHQPYLVKLIKLIDRLDNINEMDPEKDSKFVMLYSDETMLLVEKALYGTNALLEHQLIERTKELRLEAQGYLRLVVLGEAK